MAYNIPEILGSRKAREGLLLTAVALLGLISFGMGRLSAAPGEASVLLCDAPPSIPAQTSAQLKAATAAVAMSQTGDSAVPQGVAAGSYVASKSGSAYHLPWCSGAKRIKEENKVWFATKEEAEAAGYRPAANCKGL